MIAEVIAFDFSTSSMTVPLLVAAGVAVIGYFLLTKKEPEQQQASSLVTTTAGLFSGHKLTMLASFAALLMQAGSLRDFVKKALSKIIDFANQDQPKPDDTPPTEAKK